MKKAIESGEARDGADVKKQLFPTVPARTIRRELCEIGLNGRVRRKKPMLTRKHVEKRLEWAKAHVDWTLEQWLCVYFSDESKFCLTGSDGKRYCRRRTGEEFLPQNVTKTVKHGGGSLMVWGCITPDGVGRLHRVEGKMNAAQYVSILEEELFGTLRDHSSFIDGIYFQQDNDPKHTSKLAKYWFIANDVDVLPWAASSADANIIEPVWDHLDRRVRMRPHHPTNLNELWEVLQEEWYSIDVQYIRNLYMSMPRRVAAILEAKGSYTKY